MTEARGGDIDMDAWLDSPAGGVVRDLMGIVHAGDFPITLPDERNPITFSDEAVTMRAVIRAAQEVMPQRA